MLLVNCSAGLALGNVRSTHSKAVWVGCAGTQKQKYQTPACTSLPNFCCSPHQQQRLPGACMWQTCSRAKFRICPLSLLNYAKIKLTRLPQYFSVQDVPSPNTSFTTYQTLASSFVLSEDTSSLKQPIYCSGLACSAAAEHQKYRSSREVSSNAACKAALRHFWCTLPCLQLQEVGHGSSGHRLRNSEGIASAPYAQDKGQKSGKQMQNYLEELRINTLLRFRKTLGFSHSFQAQNVYFSSF